MMECYWASCPTKGCGFKGMASVDGDTCPRCKSAIPPMPEDEAPDFLLGADE